MDKRKPEEYHELTDVKRRKRLNFPRIPLSPNASQLPGDVLQIIFRFLSIRELYHVMQSSKRFFALAESCIPEVRKKNPQGVKKGTLAYAIETCNVETLEKMLPQMRNCWNVHAFTRFLRVGTPEMAQLLVKKDINPLINKRSIYIHDVRKFLIAGQLETFLIFLRDQLKTETIDLLGFEKSLIKRGELHAPFFDLLCFSGKVKVVDYYLSLVNIGDLQMHLSHHSIAALSLTSRVFRERYSPIPNFMYMKYWNFFRLRRFPASTIAYAVATNCPEDLLRQMIQFIETPSFTQLFNFWSSPNRPSDSLPKEKRLYLIHLIHQTKSTLFMQFNLHEFMKDVDELKLIYSLGFRLSHDQIKNCIYIDNLESFRFLVEQGYQISINDLLESTVNRSSKIFQYLYSSGLRFSGEALKILIDRIYTKSQPGRGFPDHVNSALYGMLVLVNADNDVPLSPYVNVAEFSLRAIEIFAERHSREDRLFFTFQVINDRNNEEIIILIELGLKLGFDVKIGQYCDHSLRQKYPLLSL